ncbi:MAG: ABC transporter ATP-binding protein/permease [Alphaproteobacteria bacterium]|nr:ABC transporter ATP-binding protein/permease [Alphaproteobacteria bacterium]
MHIFKYQHTCKTNTDTKLNTLPKTLIRFYLRYAMHGQWKLLIYWLVIVTYLRSAMVLWPLTEKWFIAMFEQPVTGIQEFILSNLSTVLLIVGLNISWSLCGALDGILNAKRNAYMVKQISETITDYLHRQSMAFWADVKSGSINTKITYLTRGINVMDEVLRIIALIITISINVWLMTQINSWITIIFAIMFISRLLYTFYMRHPVKNAATAASDAQSNLSGHVVDSLTNSFIVRMFAGAQTEHNYLDKPRQEQVKKHIKSRLMQTLMLSPFDFMWDFGFGCVLVMCLYLFARGELLISGAVFTISVFNQVSNSIGNLILQIPKLIEDAATATKAYTELSKPIMVVDKPNAPDLVVTHGLIEFKNVSFKYKRKWVLRNMNLTIHPGERVGLVGGSGAGKSTMMNLLMRFYDVTSGQILIDGVDIRNITQDSLRRAIGFIPQEPTLFDRSLRDNIAYGKPDASLSQIRNAAKRAAADEFIMASDKKYDSLVGERGIKLSGGQKQRIAIARAFLKDAPILILDEATSALDSETEIAIQKSFEELASDRTTVAIAHRLSTLRNMDKIVVMRNGKIIEQGTHNQLLRNKHGEYARMWKLQSGGFLTEY